MLCKNAKTYFILIFTFLSKNVTSSLSKTAFLEFFFCQNIFTKAFFMFFKLFFGSVIFWEEFSFRIFKFWRLDLL